VLLGCHRRKLSNTRMMNATHDTHIKNARIPATTVVVKLLNTTNRDTEIQENASIASHCLRIYHNITEFINIKGKNGLTVPIWPTIWKNRLQTSTNPTPLGSSLSSSHCDCKNRRTPYVSEWLNSFLTAHQHIIGYSLPCKGGHIGLLHQYAIIQ